MKNTIEETTRLLLNGTLSKEDADKILLNICNVSGWVAMSKKEPPDIVEYYLTIDTFGDMKELEWYEGDSFLHTTGGHWSDEDGNEVKNITHWMKVEPPCH